MNSHTPTCLNKKYTYKLMNNFTVDIKLEENPYSISLDQLFAVAARINKKRSFLFVSKVLGKHIPIKPITGINIGYLLALRYMEVVKNQKTVGIQDTIKRMSQFIPERSSRRLEHNPVIIGFAETATALGHSFFESFQHGDYFHTTRESLTELRPTIVFEEEHSHATSHHVYANKKLFQDKREIILVDDELTTGKTALNIIRSIQNNFPRKEYSVVSILDWRSEEDVRRFKEVEEELGVRIHCVSLVKGQVSTRGNVGMLETDDKNNPIPSLAQEVQYYHISNPSPINSSGTKSYLSYTGRFGISSSDYMTIDHWTQKIGEELAPLRLEGKTLVLGTGEFMYIPMKIANHMGDNVYYQSTTRSPVHPFHTEGYGVQSKYSFLNPEDHTIPNFVYNIPGKYYEDLFVFFEKSVEKNDLQNFLDALKYTTIKRITIVHLY